MRYLKILRRFIVYFAALVLLVMIGLSVYLIVPNSSDDPSDLRSFVTKLLLWNGKFCSVHEVVIEGWGWGEGTLGVLCTNGQKYIFSAREHGGGFCDIGLIKADCFYMH